MAMFSNIRKNFQPAFWVANGMELFERLAYYGQNAIFSVYLRDHLHLSIADAGKLQSLFGGLLYALPVIGGALADKFGFRKAFATAFSTLAIGYFLIGSAGMESMNSLYSALPLMPMLSLWIIITAFGGSFIKPSVLGTVALTTTEESKSFGYALYYWLVNIGAALGPVLAFAVRSKFGIEFVYLVSAISCLLMFVVNQLWFKGVQGAAQGESLATTFKQFIAVLRNGKFVVFLLIFSLFWMMFWQEFIIIPYYIRDFISPNAPFEIIASAGAWGIIVFQLIINRLTKNISAQHAIVIGFAIASCGWLLPAFFSSIPAIIAAIVIFSIGEMVQAPRYYEYISSIAPSGQQGMYQGFAFLPIAIAYAFGGVFGAWMYNTLAISMQKPTGIWFVLCGIGVIATASMGLYNRINKPLAK